MSYFDKLKRLFLPYTCVLCAELSDQPRDLCRACEQELPKVDTPCRCCGIRLPATSTSHVCGECLTRTHTFDRTFALCEYGNPIDHMISAAKFNNHLIYTRLFGELLAEQVASNWYADKLPDLIIPVPLHPERIRKRGYNQSLEIAKTVSKKLKLPFDRNQCIRVKPTAPQSGLAHAERVTNMKGAFSLRKPLSAKHVAIIDDVVTTGNTVTELSRILKQAGAQQVDVWCCARTQWSG